MSVSQSCKKLLRKSAKKIASNRVRARIRVGEQFSSGAIIAEPLVRNHSYSPKILQLLNFLNCNTDLSNFCKNFYF